MESSTQTVTVESLPQPITTQAPASSPAKTTPNTTNILTSFLNQQSLVTVLVGIACGMGALPIAVSFLMFGLPANPFILLLLPIVISAWYAGLKSGAYTAAVIAVGSYILFVLQPIPLRGNLPTLWLDLPLFLVSALLVSYVVERARQHEAIEVYKEREQTYLARIATMEEQAAKAKQEIKARDEFLSIASHELKTPLTSMLLQLQTALHNVRSVSLANFSVESLMKMLESAEHQSMRLSRMINDLLNVSLITTGRLDLNIEKTDLKKLVEEVKTSFDERLANEQYTLTVDAPEPVWGKWDKIRVGQVVANLISNAIKYGDHKPLLLRVYKDGKTAKIVVKDHGIGIAPEQQKQIFALFDRGNTTAKAKGLGVGLYITNQIITAHKGTIQVDSKPKDGSTFIVSLPIEQ